MQVNIRINKLNRSKVAYVLINVAFLIFWFLFTHNTRLQQDDLHYKYIIGTDTMCRNIMDVLRSQILHYQKWGGRSVAHFLDQFYLLYDKIFFDLSNSIVFVLTNNLIYSFRKDKTTNNSLLILIYLAYFFCAGDLFSSMIWQTGSFNYLWMIFTSLLFVKVIYTVNDRDSYIIRNVEEKNVYCVLFFLYSIIAGWGHELISPVVIFSLGVLLLYKLYEKHMIYKIEFFGFAGYAVGTAVCILAPGNFVRLNSISVFNTYPLIIRWAFAFFRNAYFLIYYTAPAMIIMIQILYISYMTKSKNMIKKIVYYIAILVFSNSFYIVVYGWASRIISIQITIMSIVIARFYDNIEQKEIKDMLTIFSFFFFVVFIILGVGTLYYMHGGDRNILHQFRLVG